MPKMEPYTIRLSSVVKEKVHEYCVAQGVKQGYFVERALLEKLTREAKTYKDSWQVASGIDILKKLGPMSDEEARYYESLSIL
jgi:hypothetical protein